MKILYLVTDDWYFVSHRLRLARAARDAGCEVVVVTEPSTCVGDIEAEGFRHRAVRFKRTVWSQPGNALLSRRLAAIYREERPDLVHHVSFLPQFYGTRAARRAGVPAVVNAVTGLGHAFVDGRRGRPLLRFALEHGYRSALRGSNVRAIFQNEDDQRLFRERRWVDPERGVCIPGSGVDTERFVPRPESDPSAGPPTILHASRMLWSKGVGDSVEASRILRRRGVEHRLVLAGRVHPTNPRAISEQTLTEWTREGVAEWIGPSDSMPELLAQSHVVSLPTRYREGVPQILIEAASSARPIVTTDVPGCTDIVEDERNGLLVPARDPQALARAFERLLGDAELRGRFGAAGRERVLERFAMEIVNDRTLALYRELVPDAWPRVVTPAPPPVLDGGAERPVRTPPDAAPR